MSVFYNDNDPKVARWLRALIAAGELPAGVVNERSILGLDAAQLRSFRQCHFFVGIGGWPYALALAGWSAEREVWTASCPCQPLSSAGQRQGHLDERHLWPAFYRLVAFCRPATIFGEQVASADGREWLAGVRLDLEGLGYAVGGADLPAAGVGAPHIRQRLFWVADAGRDGSAANLHARAGSRAEPEFGSDGRSGDLAYPIGERLAFERGLGRFSYAADGTNSRQAALGTGACSGAVADTERDGGRANEPRRRTQGRIADLGADPWAGAEWLGCLDDQARRVEPGVFPLAHGVPARVGRLRGYGNAIVPQVAARFIEAYLEI